jgi:hypothetical protein
VGVWRIDALQNTWLFFEQTARLQRVAMQHRKHTSDIVQIDGLHHNHRHQLSRQST